MHYRRLIIVEEYSDEGPLPYRPIISDAQLTPIPIQVIMAKFDADRRTWERNLRGPQKPPRSMDDITATPGWECGLDQF